MKSCISPPKKEHRNCRYYSTTTVVLKQDHLERKDRPAAVWHWNFISVTPHTLI